VIEGEPMTDEGALNDFWPVHAERGGAPAGDAAIGRVTAGAWSPRLEKNIGYAWVPSAHAGGDALEVRSSTGPAERS
jgi:glycine cleavage system aminomethyltransferase T